MIFLACNYDTAIIDKDHNNNYHIINCKLVFKQLLGPSA